MPTFSFDITSGYDKAELNNVFAQAERDIANRYDFKGTPAAIEWLDDKAGFKLVGQNQWQIDALLDIIRKKLASRELSAKLLDLTQSPHESNLRVTWSIPFKQSLKTEDTKRITKLLKAEHPKLKAQIQGDDVRVSGSSKDDLQTAMRTLQAHDFDTALSFTNFR